MTKNTVPPETGEASPESSRPGKPIEPRRLVRAVWAGRWLILAAAIVGGLIGVAYAKLAVRRTFETSASIRYEGSEPLDPDTPPDIRREFPPLLEPLRREGVLNELKNRMELQPVPLAVIQARFNTIVDGDAGLLTLIATGDSPEDAANFANTLIDVFLQHLQQERATAIQAAIALLDTRIRAAQEDAGRAQAAYDTFRREHGVSTELTDDQTAAMGSAADLRARAALAQATVSGLEARVSRLRDQLASAPASTGSSTAGASSSAREALAEARRQLDSVRGRLSPDHPRFQALEQQVATLEAQVRAAGGGGGGGESASLGRATQSALREAEAQLESARREQAQLADLARQAQERVVSFSAIEGEAAERLADVNVKTQLVTALRNRRARLENLLSEPDPGFRIVARAVAPESALPSRRKYYIAGGVPAVLIALVIFFYLIRELRHLRLYSADEVAFWANAPVVGATTWPRVPGALRELVADFDDYIPDSRGDMLVVGGSDKEMPLAAELARELNTDFSGTERPFEQAAPAPHVTPHPSSAPWADAGWHSDNASPLGNPLEHLQNAGAPGQASTTGRHAASARHDLLAPPMLPVDETALARSGAPRSALAQRVVANPWEGNTHPQGLRRAARLAHRVLVLVPSGGITIPELSAIRAKLGREQGVGFVVVNVADDIASLPDRSGPVDAFWDAQRAETRDA